MGRKKRAATRRRNLPASAPQSPTPPRPQPPPIASCRRPCCRLPDPGPDLDPSIREDSWLAWTCLREGSIAEGFEIIQESISRHPNDVTLLRTRAVMHFRLGSLSNQNFIQHFKDCIASAEQAIALCPNLIGLMAIYAMSLFGLAKDKADYENVIRQCQKALSIQDPVDPGKDVLVFQPDTEVEDGISKEARIESARRELRFLIQKSNEILMNMENCSKDDAGDKKASEAAMKKGKNCKDKDDAAGKTKTAQSLGDDEMWEPFVVSRKSQEAKRLAIEKELDNVRAWQHKIHMGGVAKDENGREGSKVGRRIRVLQYWKGLSQKKQRAFLRINVDELRDFYKSDQSLAEVLKEAIEFLKELRSWKFWECNICEKRFLDGELWGRHLDSKDHFGVLSDEDAQIVPELLEDAWLNKIVSGVWRPVDVDKMLKHVAEEARAKQEVGHDVAGESEKTMEDREMDIDEKKWSYCDDAQRKGMLDQICCMFRLILRNSCLTQSMVRRWLRLTRFQLEKKCQNVREVFPDLEKTPLGICFLEYDQLEMLYRMTCDIYEHCQMVPLSKNGNFYEQIPSEEEYKERIDYAENFSCLLLDERFLTGEFKPQESIDLADDESFVYWLFVGAEIGELVKSWKGVKAQKLEIAYSACLFICTEMELLQLLCKKKLWLSKYERALSVVRNMCLQESSRSKTMQNHEPQKLVHLLWQKKDMHIDTKEEDDLFVCNIITDILKDSSAVCAKNFVSEAASFGLYTQESDSRARVDEERQMKDRVVVDAEAAKLNVLEAIKLKRKNVEKKLCIVEGLITKSLADIEGMSQNFGLLTAHDTQESELRAHEDEERWMKDRLLADAEAAELYVLEAIELKRNDIERKFCIVDSLIMKSLADIERMRQNFGLSTAHDSRAIMLHLLKSFIRAHLENFASKDDEEKAWAAEKDSKEKDDATMEKKKSAAQYVGGDEMWEPFVISRKCQEVKRLAIEKELDKVRAWQHEIYKGLIANYEDGYLGRFESMLGQKMQVLQYWRGLSCEERKAFLKVDVNGLEHFYASDEFLSGILKEAVGFLKELGSWKFWECNICEQRFLDGEFWMFHLENHFWVLSLEDRGILPDELDDAWMNKIVSGDWKPVDVDKMLKHIIEEARAKEEVGPEVAGESEMDIDEKKWPYCDDAKRKGMLDRICCMFGLILRNSCLSQSMVQRWLRLTRFQLEKKCPDVREMFPDLENTPLGICFLESDQLEMLYRMTCEIYKHCQMLASSKDDRFYDDVPREEEYREMIDYTDDFSFLLLDERFLTGEFKPEKCSYLEDEEFFVHWLYGGARIEELVNSWTGVRAQKLEIADSAYQFICQELELLQSLCKKKLWLSTHERAFQVVRNMCFPENRWETMPSHEPQNLVLLLRLQQDIITKILGEARAACARNLGSEGALFDVDAQESELGAREDEEQWMHAELCVLEAIELKRNDIERKFCIVDGLIMKSLADIKRMKQNFGLSTAHDFRTIMLHLLKSFIRAQLENFASKDAEEKAKAAEKALLNVLGLDSNKKNEDEKATNVGKKSKKKKAFYKRYPKDKKTSGSEETVELEKENTEVSFPISSSSGISYSGTSDESRKLERQMLTEEIVEDEQLMRLIESEGMTPEEMIENQRQIEEDIRQNRLEELSKEVNETDSNDVEDEEPLVTSTGEAEEPSVSEPPQHSQTVISPVDSILIGAIPVRLFPRPGNGDGSSTRNLLLPTESYTNPGETNIPDEIGGQTSSIPAELMQVEQSEPITLPETGTAEVGDSLPRAENDGLDDSEIFCREDKNIPDLEVGMHNPDVDAFNGPDRRSFISTNIKRRKVCYLYVHKYRGYSSA